MADGAVAQALVLDTPRRLVVWELLVPLVCDDDARVRMAACGLCGTDHAVVNVTALAPAAIALARPAGTVVPRRCVGLDDAEDLLAAMVGERDDVPPVHGVLAR
jgi:hypothetical protein